MARGLSLEVEGLNDAINKLKEMGSSKIDAIDLEIKAMAFDIVEDAQLAAPVDLNALRGSIRVASSTPKGATIEVSANYAAYVEFGTGPEATAYLATQPGEVKDYARQFYVNGQGHMPARPFFFPAVYKNFNLLVARITKILNK